MEGLVFQVACSIDQYLIGQQRSKSLIYLKMDLKNINQTKFEEVQQIFNLLTILYRFNDDEEYYNQNNSYFSLNKVDFPLNSFIGCFLSNQTPDIRFCAILFFIQSNLSTQYYPLLYFICSITDFCINKKNMTFLSYSLINLLNQIDFYLTFY